MKSPNQLSVEAIKEFKEIYSEEFGQTLSDEGAEQIGIDILRLFDLLLTPQQATSEAE